MRIDQADIAHLSDQAGRAMAVAAWTAKEQGGAGADFMGRFSLALVGALRARRRAVLVLEAEFMNHDEPGALVEEGSDPVADALEEWRAEIRRDEGLS